MTAEAEAPFETLFPEDRCVTIVGELSAWTSVQSIMAAARYIEGRSIPSDQLEPRLIMPMPLGYIFERVFLETIKWLDRAYRVPQAKISLARALDPAMTDATAARLQGTRFSPTITSAPSEIFKDPDAGPAGSHIFFVDADPVVIEMVQSPLRCLMQMLSYGFEQAERMRSFQLEAKRLTGGAPTIYHRPLADSRLNAMLEALCYYALGFPLLLTSELVPTPDIDRAYRSVNVRGRPPFSPPSFDRARAMMEAMLHGLA